MIRVKLLDVSANADKLIYVAGRQCYAEGWAGDSWEKQNDDISILDKKTNKEISNKEIEALIKHLVSSGHTSVLEHVKFTFAIDGVSRSETHQHVRHRIASYSQQSQRYVSNESDFNSDNYVYPPSIRRNELAYTKYEDCLKFIQNTYNDLKKLGIPSEDARYLMPNASVSRLIDTKNCVSLLHFFGLRCCTLAQWEIRDLANKMLTICKEVLPVVFENAGSRCVSLGYCPEDKKRSCGIYPTKKDVLDGYNLWKEHYKTIKDLS